MIDPDYDELSSTLGAEECSGNRGTVTFTRGRSPSWSGRGDASELYGPP